MSRKSLKDLNPTSFENLCFDTIRHMGFHNPTWRTPGADGGRDIEAWRTTVDPTFTVNSERWFIECKKYSSSINWPTIYEKIAHAEALGADYVFLMTTSSASPTCIDRIESWNRKNKKPKIRIWGGHNIISYISTANEIASKYGLKISSITSLELSGISLEMSKVISTIHSLSVFKKDASIAIEYANALSRCYTERVKQVKDIGKFFKLNNDLDLMDYKEIKFLLNERNKLSQSEVLIIYWILFITEKNTLELHVYKNRVFIKLSFYDIAIVMKSASNRAITFLSGAAIETNNDGITITEDVYG